MGIVEKRHSKLVTLLSAWSEIIGYVASISLCLIRQRDSLEKEIELIRGAQQQKFVRTGRRKLLVLSVDVCVRSLGDHADVGETTKDGRRSPERKTSFLHFMSCCP